MFLEVSRNCLVGLEGLPGNPCVLLSVSSFVSFGPFCLGEKGSLSIGRMLDAINY